MEDLYIGDSPWDEKCLQVGKASSVALRTESIVFKRQIERYYPIPDGARLVVRGQSHEFGTYYSVFCVVDPEVETQVDWACAVESDELEKLSHWDEESKAEIQQAIDYNHLPSDYYEQIVWNA